MRSYPFTSQVTYDDEGLPLYDRAVDSSFLRRVFAQYFSDGVFYKPTSALQVVADTGMQVAVEPGCCHIQGAIGIEDSRRTLVVQAAESLDRIDTVVARLDLSLAARDIDLYVVKGTAAASPQPPELTRDATVWELGLANLFVAKNTQTISQQRITDTRLDSARCSVVAQTIGALDTEPYYTQLSAMIDDLREVIAGIEAGSEVMLKTVYDPRGVAKDVFAQIPNPNLLDNSDFINVVNQRGKTSYNSAYTIDRWTLGVDGPIVEVVSGKGVKLSNGDPTYGAPLVQKVNPVSVSESRGNYTFSVCDDGGSIYSVTGKFTENSESITPWGKLLLTLYSGIPAVQIKLNQGQEKTFVWAKLELGDVVTPWKPKGYGVELSECMRYYQVRTVMYQGYQIKGITVQVPFDFHPMRNVPTGAFVGTPYYFNATFSTFDIRSFGAAVNLIVGVNDGIVAFQGNVALSADL